MATFETFALHCAAGVALDLLAAIASVESGMRPHAIRDGDKLTVVQSPGEGVAVVVAITDQGREPGIGLMGLTPRQLRAAGLSLQDGFDTCSALKAAASVFGAAQTSAASRGHGDATADRAAVRSWWRPDSRFSSATALEAAVAQGRTQAATLIKKDLGGAPLQAATPKPSHPSVVATTQRGQTGPTSAPDCWDIFARQRAGLSQCEAPNVSAFPSTEAPTPSALSRTTGASPIIDR